MTTSNTKNKDEYGVPIFKTTIRHKIRRVVVFFALILLVLDIVSSVQNAKFSCFYLISPVIQGFATVVVDLLLLLVYTRKDTEKSRTKSTRTSMRFSYGDVIWRFIVLAMTLAWPIHEIIATRAIIQPVGSDCQDSFRQEISLGRNVRVYDKDTPTVFDLAKVLKVARARTSVCAAVSIFLAVEMVLAYKNLKASIRRDKSLAAKAKAISTTGIELSAVQSRA